MVHSVKRTMSLNIVCKTPLSTLAKCLYVNPREKNKPNSHCKSTYLLQISFDVETEFYQIHVTKFHLNSREGLFCESQPLNIFCCLKRYFFDWVFQNVFFSNCFFFLDFSKKSASGVVTKKTSWFALTSRDIHNLR